MNLSDQLELISNWFELHSDAMTIQLPYEETFPAESDHLISERAEDYHSIDFSVVLDGKIRLILNQKNNYYGFYCKVYDYEDLDTPIITLHNRDRTNHLDELLGKTNDTMNVKAFHTYVIKFSRYFSDEESSVSLEIAYDIKLKPNRCIRYNY